MLKEVLASNAAKLVAACVCPVVGGAVALKVPTVRAAIHKASAPKPQRTARAKPRIRAPLKKAAETPDSKAPVETALLCPQPVMLAAGSLQPIAFQTPQIAPPRIDMPAPERNFIPTSCGPSRFMIGGTRMGLTAVPEPATWAQMVAGFGLLGAMVRAGRRRDARHAAVTRAA